MIEETTDFSILADMETHIPEFEDRYSPEKIEKRLRGREYLALIARVDGGVVAYKVGYAETEARFYSWIGGVVPDHRRSGWASELLHYQERWCRERGFKEIQVWTANRYRKMLLFLLKEEYEIYAVAADSKVLMRKRL